jgi:transposase
VLHLVEISVMEQRYQAVLAVVQDGWKVSEVADRLSESRQSVHKWIARHEQGALGADCGTERKRRASTLPMACGCKSRGGRGYQALGFVMVP